MTVHNIRNLLILMVAAIMLAACGGSTSGGDDDGGGSSSGDTGGGGNNGDSTPSQPVVKLGSFDADGDFNKGEIAANQPKLQAGASTTLTVSIIDENGVAVTEEPDPEFLTASDIDIFFTSQCINNGLSEVAPPVVTNENGTVTTSYTALGCEGSDVVTARTSVNNTTLDASVALRTEQAQLGSIQFDSADPQIIGIKGSGSLPSQARVSFLVTNNTGGPVPNQPVKFSLNTKVGGITLNSTQAITDTNGRVSTTVNSGTQAATVRVTAKALRDGNTAEAQSSALAITTGIPDNDSFSISATSLNIEGFQRDGETTQINVLTADRFNNPVPDGTAIAFTTEGGSIDGSCTTTDGGCSVTLTSQNPRPADGRVTVLATAIGEETFVDANPSNGRFDDAENFSDLSEAFRDDNFDDVRQDSEPFIDFNSNGTFDGPNGRFEGLLCNGPTKCGSDTLNIRAGLEIIFAASSFDVEVTPNPIDLNSGAVDVTISVVDPNNGQRPPEGTTIVADATQGDIVDSDTGLGFTRTFTEESRNDPGPATYDLTLEPDGLLLDSNGTLSVTVTTPAENVSSGSARVDQTPPPLSATISPDPIDLSSDAKTVSVSVQGGSERSNRTITARSTQGQVTPASQELSPEENSVDFTLAPGKDKGDGVFTAIVTDGSSNRIEQNASVTQQPDGP